MSDRDQADRYWNLPRVLLAIVMVGAVTTVTLYGLWDNITPDRRGQFSGHSASLSSIAEPATLFNLDHLLIDKNNLRRGGPPKDGIPSLTDPALVEVGDPDQPNDDARVVSVVINNEARAYPINILNYHEAVNDTFADIPIAVVYCPLCDSVSVFDRRLGDTTYEFGISGLLSNSNVLLYDRTDQALWSQVRMTAISGPNAGESLKHLSGWRIETFGSFRMRHPDASVLSTNTGHGRDYRRQPYASYFQTDDLMFPAEPKSDAMANKTRVVGVKFKDGKTIAYPLDKIAGEISDAGVMLRYDQLADELEVVALPDDAKVVHTFWFAWYAFHPQTQVYTSP